MESTSVHDTKISAKESWVWGVRVDRRQRLVGLK
jgi:hypothetical protein